MCKELKPAIDYANNPALQYASLSGGPDTRDAEPDSSSTTPTEQYPDLASLGQTVGVQVFNLSELESAIPEEIKKILRCTNTQAADKALRDLVDPISKDILNNESSYKDSSNYKEKGYKVTDWASGGGVETFRLTDQCYRFQKEEHTLFFEDLFCTVAAKIKATCSRNNLFHGHAVFDPDHNDLRIVFHAFEYPLGMEKLKSEQAAKIEPKVQPFEMSEDFNRRNVIWSLNSHKLFILDCGEIDSGNPCEKWLVENNKYVVEQTKIGDELVAFNYFPKEFPQDKEKALFLKA